MAEEVDEDFVVSPWAYDADGNLTEHVEGAEVEFCEECDAHVWVSPSSRPILAQGYKLICIPCCFANHSDRLFDAEARVAPGAIQELIDHLKKT